MAIDFSELMGTPQPSQRDRTIERALLVMLLRSMLEKEDLEPPQGAVGLHPLPEQPEVRVRPRYERVGGG